MNFEWDGKGSDGSIVPDGSYSYTLTSTDKSGNRASYSIPRIIVDTKPTPVRLEVEYEKGNLPVAMTALPVLLDLSGPEIQASVSPLPFSPDDDGTNDVLSIRVSETDKSGVKAWSARILDPMGNLFLSIPSNRFRSGVFQWDGTTAGGELVQSASDYNLMSTFGRGGYVPVVPHGDLDNRWKNRRVEFYLVKN